MGVIVDDAQEVREMAQKAALDGEATPTGPQSLPTIDPESLTPSQQDGTRCAVPNCRRLLKDMAYKVGRLPTGEPVLACEDCVSTVSYEAAEELGSQGMIPEQHPWERKRGPGSGRAA